MKHFRAASMRPASFDETENTIDVVWTTGAAVRRRDYRNGTLFDEVLSLAPGHVRLGRLNAGAPLLDTHDDSALSRVIGSVVPGSARIENGVGVAKIKLSRAEADKAAIEKIKDGIIRNISVGYAVHQWSVGSGSNGADETRTAVDWEPLEISAVPVPADAGAQFRSIEHDDTPAAARARMIARQAAQDDTPAAARARMKARLAAVGIKPRPSIDEALVAGRCIWTIPNEELS